MRGLLKKYLWNGYILTNFIQMFHFYTPWKLQLTFIQPTKINPFTEPVIFVKQAKTVKCVQFTYKASQNAYLANPAPRSLTSYDQLLGGDHMRETDSLLAHLGVPNTS